MRLHWEDIRRQSQRCRPNVACAVSHFFRQCRKRATGIRVREIVRECRGQFRRKSHEQSDGALMQAKFQANRLSLPISFVERVQHRLGISRSSFVVGDGRDLEEHDARIAACECQNIIYDALDFGTFAWLL